MLNQHYQNRKWKKIKLHKFLHERLEVGGINSLYGFTKNIESFKIVSVR